MKIWIISLLRIGVCSFLLFGWGCQSSFNNKNQQILTKEERFDLLSVSLLNKTINIPSKENSKTDSGGFVLLFGALGGYSHDSNATKQGAYVKQDMSYFALVKSRNHSGAKLVEFPSHLVYVAEDGGDHPYISYESNRINGIINPSDLIWYENRESKTIHGCPNRDYISVPLSMVDEINRNKLFIRLTSGIYNIVLHVPKDVIYKEYKINIAEEIRK